MWYLTELCSKPKNLAPKGEVFRSMYEERAKTTKERWLHISSMCCTIMEGAPHWLIDSWYFKIQVSKMPRYTLQTFNFAFLQLSLVSYFPSISLSFLLPSSLLLYLSFYSSFYSFFLPYLFTIQFSTICFSSWASHAMLRNNYRTSNRIRINTHTYARTHRNTHIRTHTHTHTHTHVFHWIINNKCTTKTRHVYLH